MKFVVSMLKGAKQSNWMMLRSGLRRAMNTGELSIPSLLEVFYNIVGVWPFIVFYIKETGKNTDGDNSVV